MAAWSWTCSSRIDLGGQGYAFHLSPAGCIGGRVKSVERPLAGCPGTSSCGPCVFETRVDGSGARSRWGGAVRGCAGVAGLAELRPKCGGLDASDLGAKWDGWRHWRAGVERCGPAGGRRSGGGPGAGDGACDAGAFRVAWRVPGGAASGGRVRGDGAECGGCVDAAGAGGCGIG